MARRLRRGIEPGTKCRETSDKPVRPLGLVGPEPDKPSGIDFSDPADANSLQIFRRSQLARR